MAEPAIQDFHAHIYFDPDQVEAAKQLAAEAQARFGVSVGHFTRGPSGRTRAAVAN